MIFTITKILVVRIAACVYSLFGIVFFISGLVCVFLILICKLYYTLYVFYLEIYISVWRFIFHVNSHPYPFSLHLGCLHC